MLADGDHSRSRPSYLRPPAVVVGGLGLVATLSVLVLPPLRDYAGGWPLLLGLTLLCYILLAASQAGSLQGWRRVKDPDLEAVIRLRRDMESRLAGLPPNSPLTQGVPELLQRLDQELIPSLSTLVARRQTLARRLAEYDYPRATLRPDAATLKRLRALHERQNQAVRDVVQQVVNMDAALLGLMEEGDQKGIADQVREWAQELDIRWKVVAEVLGGEDPLSPPVRAEQKR